MIKYRYTCLLLLGLCLGLVTCKDRQTEREAAANPPVAVDTALSGVRPSNFRDTVDGEAVALYRLTNENGLEATVTNYGLRLVSLMVPDREGNLEDVVLGFDSLEEYRQGHGKYYGSVVGRYGNRIGGATFTLDGKAYPLAKNNGENHLHGGVKGFESVVWAVDSLSGNHIRFRRTSPHMEEGYPGNLEVIVSYTLTDDNAFSIAYWATTDRKTPVNLTHHSYFNLKGAGEGSTTDHLLELNADLITPVDPGLIPIGTFQEVAGTAFDFRSPKPIGQDIEAGEEQLKLGRGYDHNFVLNDSPINSEGLTFAARVTEPQSGRVMEVFTNEPGVQFYGGNFMDGSRGKKGLAYIFRGAFCLETQHFPDSPNKPNFPDTILEPGETYHSRCVYKFTVDRHEMSGPQA